MTPPPGGKKREANTASKNRNKASLSQFSKQNLSVGCINQQKDMVLADANPYKKSGCKKQRLCIIQCIKKCHSNILNP